MGPERDEDRNDSAPPSIFSLWWVRAVLGLIVLALIAVIALPYFPDWFSPAPKGPVTVLKPKPAPSLRPSPPPASPTTLTPPPQVATPSAAAKPPREVATQAPKQSPETTKEDDEAAPGRYMVQVGAFQDADNAARLATQLAREKYPVRRATVPRPAARGGGHEVVVVGASADEVNGRLRGTAHKALATRDGAVIQPALPLKEAVALSQELKASGLTVKIRRAQGSTTLHIVRVGEYSNRSRAEAVRKELEEKGFSGFIVREARR